MNALGLFETLKSTIRGSHIIAAAFYNSVFGIYIQTGAVDR